MRSETSPEDVHGMMVAEGILTARAASCRHAAVVARGWGTPAVVGAEAIKINGAQFTVGDMVVREGDVISLDGSTGEVVLGAVDARRRPSRRPSSTRSSAGPTRSARATSAVRANADNGPDADQRPRSSAPRASACAAPSTCSSARTACRSCAA